MLEALAARAWPALEHEPLDGWVLRHTPQVGHRRLNSAQAMNGDAGLDDDVVAAIGDFYARRARAAMVQVGPVEEQAELDAALAALGWTAEGRTDVLVAAADDVVAACGDEDGVAVATGPDPSWLAAWETVGTRADARDTYAHVLTRVAAPAGFAVATREGAPVGVGMVACEGPWAGVFCMATAPGARRRGVARSILGALAAWAREQGAPSVYLQVVASNAPAYGLYTSAGFTRSHGYHYRVAR